MTQPRDIIAMLHCAVTGELNLEAEGHSEDRLLVHDWAHGLYVGTATAEVVGSVNYEVHIDERSDRLTITTSDNREFEVVVLEHRNLNMRTK